MTAGIWNFMIEQNATFERVITWEDDDGPVDPTGWTAAMQVRTSGGALIFELSSEDPPGGIVLDGETMSMTITIPATDTLALDFKGGHYDIRLVHPGGEDVQAVRLLEGKIDVLIARTV